MLLDFQKKIIESPLSILLAVIVLLSLGILTLYSITVTQGQEPPNALSKPVSYTHLTLPTILLV